MIGDEHDPIMPDVSALVDAETMRLLVKTSLEGLAIIDEQGRWLFINPAGLQVSPSATRRTSSWNGDGSPRSPMPHTASPVRGPLGRTDNQHAWFVAGFRL